MSTPMIENLRTLLRQIRQKAQARHQAYQECEQTYAQRKEAVEKAWQEGRERLEQALAQKKAALAEEHEQALERINSRFQKDHQRHTLEHAATKRRVQEQYETNKTQGEAQFKENRWTIVTLHEADKKVARDQFLQSQRSLKENRAKMRSQYQEGRKLVRSWKVAENLEVPLNQRPNLAPAEPWKALEQRTERATTCLNHLKILALPRLLQGNLLSLGIALAWLVLSLPALVVDPWYLWLVASTATILPGGWALRYWMTRRARQQIATFWQGLAQSVYDAQPLRRLCLEQARFLHKEQRRQSRAKHQASLRRLAEQYRQQQSTLESRLEKQQQQTKEKFEPLLEQVVQRRDRDLKAEEEKFATSSQQLKALYEREMQIAQEKHRQLKEDTEKRHAKEWEQLSDHWQKAVSVFENSLRAIERECQQIFPPWENMAKNWQPPSELPPGIPLGTLGVSADLIPLSEPEDPRLARLQLEDVVVPALLSFPEKSSLLFKAVDRGRDVAIQALQALLLRFWTSLPPGKLRCTILDPVGRGENFAAFMHLADHEEALITSRIWTEASHIEQRLTDLTTHMETVLQKFLRNKYQTLAEYNAQAGEVAEPFRLLVVAHFPVNFSTEAARRLISLASAGARCGIYTLVLVDEKQPMPHGVELADLEDVCVKLTWREGKFLWHDPEFSQYPLRLAKPPAAETCTQILGIVGEKAKWANRVEVPFESIAPPEEEMWTTDSRAGLAIPLGRTGATARQLLTLGKGTSQHVLIAGKTGSGKSTLLHVLITQLALRYSPQEVELYLIDFKKGVEFKTYASHRLPHARVVAVESEREFGLSVLQRLDVELVRRGELFRTVGVNDLPSYRQLKADSYLPRILLMVDEFQEFFVEDDKIAQEAALLMDRLVRQGRAFGIHVVLGSQTLGGAYSLARSTIDQMAVRIALQCSEADAHLILSKENSEARLLSRPGEAIYNAANGLLEGNNLFQIVWLYDHQRDHYLEKTHALAKARSWQPREPLIVFEGSTPSDLGRNPFLEKLAASGDGAMKGWHAWLGDAVAIKDPTAAVFHKQSGANLLIVGQNSELAFQLMVASLVSLALQKKRAAPLSNGTGWTGPTLILVPASPLEEESEGLLQKLPEILPVRVAAQRDLAAVLGNLNEELQRRQKDAAEGEPIFLFLFGIQRVRDLRKADDDFGFGRREENKPVSPSKMFQTLLREGPPLGIFCVVWCDSLTNLQRSFDRQGLREFEMRVLFQMNAGDSSNLMDSPVAAKLGPYRALYYTEDQGKIEKFRPYGLPTLEWLRGVFSGIKVGQEVSG